MNKNLRGKFESMKELPTVDSVSLSRDKSKWRGKPISDALYDLHKVQLAKNEYFLKEKQKSQRVLSVNGAYKNQTSSQLRINGFKKEFRA